MLQGQVDVTEKFSEPFKRGNTLGFLKIRQLGLYRSNSDSFCDVVRLNITRDCNPELKEFSIPGFGIVEFPIPGSRRDWRSIVKTTKIAKWVTVFGSLFLNYKCVGLRSCRPTI